MAKRLYFVFMIFLMMSCGAKTHFGRLKMKQTVIKDDSKCNFTYTDLDPERPKTIISIIQICPNKEWIGYFFDIDSSVWKANSWGKRRKYEHKLVYDSSFQLKITDIEKRMFKEIMKHADSLNITIFKNLDKATGFIKLRPKVTDILK